MSYCNLKGSHNCGSNKARKSTHQIKIGHRNTPLSWWWQRKSVITSNRFLVHALCVEDNYNKAQIYNCPAISLMCKPRGHVIIVYLPSVIQCHHRNQKSKMFCLLFTNGRYWEITRGIAGYFTISFVEASPWFNSICKPAFLQDKKTFVLKVFQRSGLSVVSVPVGYCSCLSKSPPICKTLSRLWYVCTLMYPILHKIVPTQSDCWNGITQFLYL